MTPEQKQRARWDLLFFNIEARTVHVRRDKPWKIMATVVTAAAALLAIGFALAKLLT